MTKIIRVPLSSGLLREGDRRPRDRSWRRKKKFINAMYQSSSEKMRKIKKGEEALKVYEKTKSQRQKVHKRLVGKKGLLFNQKF